MMNRTTDLSVLDRPLWQIPTPRKRWTVQALDLLRSLKMGLVVFNDSGIAKYTEKNRNRGQGSFRDGNASFMRLAQMKGPIDSVAIWNTYYSRE